MTRTVRCPESSAIESAVTSTTACPVDVAQIQKLVFWRTGQSIVSVTTALIQTTWDTLLAAADDTKAIVSPLLHNPDTPMGDPREFGGGNETQWGATLRKGSQSPVFSFTMLAEDQDVITSMKNWQGEYLDVLFINEANQLIYDDRAGAVYGFPITESSFNVSDKGVGGQDDADVNIMTFAILVFSLNL